MNINKIRTFLRQHASDGIAEVLNGTKNHYTNTCLCLDTAQDILIELGAESLEDIETNGWQWDFCETWKYESREFLLSGSGFYGRIEFQLLP